MLSLLGLQSCQYMVNPPQSGETAETTYTATKHEQEKLSEGKIKLFADRGLIFLKYRLLIE